MSNVQLLPISIVTTHFNDISDLSLTIDSIQEQNISNLCHIIVDAGTPGISDFIDEKSLLVSFPIYLYIVPGISLYEGINYGLNLVSTPFYQILNSGTTYFSRDSLSSCLSVAQCHHLNIYSGFIVQSSDVKTVLRFQVPAKNLFPVRVFHEGCIYPSSIFVRHSLKLPVAADLKFLVDYARSIPLSIFPDLPLIMYPKGGISDQTSFRMPQFFENLYILAYLLLNRRFLGFFYFSTRLIKSCILALSFLRVGSQ